ncbi:periphilin-1 [Spea bombifrons]|uniref:periphilin-1 n=1 Tax=Spea bombifrons TaxID=233779 RepID=UPI00234BD6FD|nr:periphilin-1 [Spea bombifrons]
MWAEGRCEYERLPRHRLPPRDYPPDGDHRRVVNVVGHRRSEENSFHHYEEYSDPDYRDYEEGHGYPERRGGFHYRGEEPGYRWQRGGPCLSQHPEYRESREGFRRKPLYHPGAYMRERSPHRRESPFFRESPVTRKDSPPSRSGSSVSSRSYSPERGKSYTSHQHNRSKERPPAHPLKSSKEASPSSSSGIPLSKSAELDKDTQASDNMIGETAYKSFASKMEKVSESRPSQVTDEYAKATGSTTVSYGDQSAEMEPNVSDLYEVSPHNSRAKAIAAKTKEIEEVYRQDCETFGMVVKMLIDKDASLEKQIQYALKQNLSEIGERCIEELKMFIAEYDAAHPDLA